MSKRRRQTYSGCSLDSKNGYLRFRFRALAPDGKRRQFARSTGYADTAENRALLRPLAKLLGAAVDAGKTIAEIDEIIGRPTPTEVAQTHDVQTPAVDSGPTIASYFEAWLAEQTLLVRKAQARDYKRHFEGYLIEPLGKIPLGELKPAD